MIFVTRPAEFAPVRCPQQGRNGTTWAYLVTDGAVTDLHAFAITLGLLRQQFVSEPPHYPIKPKDVGQALKLGAKKISRKQLCILLMK